MALYGLSIFLETAAHLRKGRRRYIATSFIITVLSSLSASLDIVTYFQALFKSTSGRHWAQIMAEQSDSWGYILSVATVGCLILFGDALLVMILSLFWVDRWLMDYMP